MSKNNVDKSQGAQPVMAAQKNATDTAPINYLSYLANIWIFLPALIYFSKVSEYALNIPMLDDYHAILRFLIEYKSAPSVSEKIGMLFSQYVDHRIFHSKLIYVLYYSIFDTINFKTLIFLGNVQLLIIFTVLVSFIRKAIPKYWNIASLLVGFCIFDLSSYENANFAMCGLQNYGIIMLFLVSMYFYDKQGPKFLVLAALFEAICICSSGNGPICALMLVLFVLLRKDKRKIIVCSTVFLICTALFYVHYARAVPRGYVPEVITMTSYTHFFFQLTGGHFTFDYAQVCGAGLLILLCSLFPYSKNKAAYYIKESAVPFVCLLGVIMATILSIAIFRVSNELKLAYGSRYLIMPHILVAMTLVLLWIKIDQSKIKWYIIPVAAVVIMLAYKQNYIYGEACLDMIKRRLEGYQYYFGSRTSEADKKEAERVANLSCKMGIYCIEDER